MRFRPASEVHSEALRILGLERRRLRAIVPSGRLTLTGSSSLPSLLTSGDVDLHLRVPHGEFESAVAALRVSARVAHAEAWATTLAVFELSGHPLPTEVAVTPIGSDHDRLFRRTWATLESDPGVRAALDELKRRHEGADEAVYRAAKGRFFAGIRIGGRHPAAMPPEDVTPPQPRDQGEGRAVREDAMDPREQFDPETAQKRENEEPLGDAEEPTPEGIRTAGTTHVVPGAEGSAEPTLPEPPTDR